MHRPLHGPSACIALLCAQVHRLGCVAGQLLHYLRAQYALPLSWWPPGLHSYTLQHAQQQQQRFTN